MRELLGVLLMSSIFLMGQDCCNEGGCDKDGDGWTSADGDCDDTEVDIHPGAEELCDGVDNDCDEIIDPDCGWAVQLQVPGNAYLYVATEEANTIELQRDGATFATLSLEAGAADTTTTLSEGAYRLRGTAPFVAHLTTTDTGGDQVASARGLEGEFLGTTLLGWAGEYLVVHNPGETEADVTLESWTGDAWTATSSGTIPTGNASSFGVGWGYYRISASSKVWAYGCLIANIENHMEYVPAVTGALVGEDFLWMLPERIGAAGLVGQCLEADGCAVTVLADGSTLSTHTLVEGEVWSDYVEAGVLYQVLSEGVVTLRDEATPNGYDASDGTTMDGDLVPGTSGVHYDTEFLLSTSTGAATSYTDRRSDLTIIGYREDTAVTVEQWVDGSWSTIDALTVGAGSVTAWATDLAPDMVLRVTTDLPIHLQLSQANSEFAWSLFSDYYGN